jgi:uncharacterized repeat protein (TIGR01451 family)
MQPHAHAPRGRRPGRIALLVSSALATVLLSFVARAHLLVRQLEVSSPNAVWIGDVPDRSHGGTRVALRELEIDASLTTGDPGAREPAGGRSDWLGKALPLLGGALLVSLLIVSVADAAVTWKVDPLASTTVERGGTLTYRVQITNVGNSDADASAAPMRFTAVLPAGLTVGSSVIEPLAILSGNPVWDCSSVVIGASSFTCTSSSAFLPPWAISTLKVDLSVGGSTSGDLMGSFTVSGGDPSSLSLSKPATTVVDSTTISSIPPPFGIDAFDGEVVGDVAGSPFTQAGGHPYAITTWIDFNTYTNPAPLKGSAWPVEPVKDVFVDLPPGLVGNPTGLGQCTLKQLVNGGGFTVESLCPPTSQVGVTFIHTLAGTNTVQGTGTVAGPVAVFNMVPPPGVPARFGFDVGGTVVTLDARLRSGSDYGLSVDVRNISEGLALAGTSLTFWGVPADPSHDRERQCPGTDGLGTVGGPTCQSGAPLTAFLRNPTSCPEPGVGLPTTLHMDSWVHPGDFTDATFVSHLPVGYPFLSSQWGRPQGPTNCNGVPFDPRIDARPRLAVAGQPSEFDVDLSLPQSDNPDVPGTADLKKAVVTLPLGVRVNPSSASGLAGCSTAQINLHSDGDAACPDGSKLGTVTVDTPLLPDPLEGSVYLAGPHDNPFDTLLAIYIVAKGPGVIVKLPGKVEADPLTGQLTTTVDDNPQTPFDNVHLEFKGGSRAALLNPPACGTYTTHAQLTGWNGSVVERDSSFSLSSDGNGTPCPGPKFTPGFAAGTESSTAGSSSPFHARFTRGDDDEELASVTVDMPNGLTGKIASVSLCAETDAKGGTCSDASKVGSVTAGAGAGPNPFYITNGRAYLTGPYKGAPYGLEIVVPAVAGPFDLGNVVVRSSLFVDKHDATVRIVSDPLPTILQGIPLDVRDVRVAVDRPGFIVNPTSCAEKRIDATIGSTGGHTAAVSARFQAAECRGLGFRPRMVLTVGGRGHTARNASSPLSTTLTMPSREQSNLRSVKVSLPTTINARLTVINDACTRAEFEASLRNCDHARAGVASAVTPLLRDPLRGNVYFVKNGHPIPDLFIALRGQVEFDLIGRVTIPGGKHLATTFDAVPDVPVRSFTLRLVGDRANGSVGAATNLCSHRGRSAKAELDYVGQNGRVLQIDQALKVKGCGKQKARKSTHRRGHGERGGR